MNEHAETIVTCSECGATVPPCGHFDWCPTLEVNRLRAALEEMNEHAETTVTYQSKPSTIEAVQWTGPDSLDACKQFANTAEKKVYVNGLGDLRLLAGKGGAQDWVSVPVGHWLVSQPGDRSDIWLVDPNYFAAKYEPVAGADMNTDETHPESSSPPTS